MQQRYKKIPRKPPAMEKNPYTDPGQPQRPTIEQIPHSGVHNNEFPHQESDMSLSDFAQKAEVPTVPVAVLMPEPVMPKVETQQVVEKKKKNVKTAVIASLAGVAVVAGSIIGINAAASGDEEKPTGGQEQVDEVVEKTPEELLVDKITGLYEQAPPENFDTMKAATVEEFKLLPIEQRLSYALYLNRDVEVLAEQWYEASGNTKDILPVVSQDNTGEEIYSSSFYMLRGAYVYHFDSRSDATEGMWTLYDRNDREKILAANTLYPSGSVYENWSNAFSLEENMGQTPEVYEEHSMNQRNESITNRSANYTLTDANGVERQAADISIREDITGEESIGTYVLIENDAFKHWVILGQQ